MNFASQNPSSASHTTSMSSAIAGIEMAKTTATMVNAINRRNFQLFIVLSP
ncbi:MAG: hypothetical protein M3122_09055 [Actinomycetota bacterium]|nr:hypothetical protein [Actinomycetota bacterium]